METDTDPLPEAIFNFSDIGVNSLDMSTLSGLVFVGILLICSGLISGSEVAMFSLTPTQKKDLAQSNSQKSKLLLALLGNPERLLATVLIANNFVNIGIVIVSTFVINTLFDFSQAPDLGFLFQVVLVTFIILLFGEILPKVMAAQRSVYFARLMTLPLYTLSKIFYPLSVLLMRSTQSIGKSKLMAKKKNVSKDQLSEALELTSESDNEEKKLLKGILNFGEKNVKAIMKPRVDVIALGIETRFDDLKSTIIAAGYSRMPIYEESFDNIKGILYIKDLLPHLNKDSAFEWQKLIRPPYFVPETKRINDLLQEFRRKKIHMAIVIDEYGGCSGLVTLEDVLEEIVGEISDENDEDEFIFKQIDEKNYIFEGKTQLVDFCKITGFEHLSFEQIKGDAETLAGLILEVNGTIPEKNKEIRIHDITFNILAADHRRIKRIRVTLP